MQMLGKKNEKKVFKNVTFPSQMSCCGRKSMHNSPNYTLNGTSERERERERRRERERDICINGWRERTEIKKEAEVVRIDVVDCVGWRGRLLGND